jgi:hypothetical protein
MSAPYDPNRRGRFFLFHPAFTFDHEEFVVDPSGYLRRWLPQTLRRRRVWARGVLRADGVRGPQAQAERG